MSFVAPLFLAGLAALALPWLLHRFSDEEPEVHPFPSDRFLEAVPPPVSRKRRIRHRALFALRIGALALLCLLFAGPVLDRLPLGAAPSEVRLFALDTSYSMRADGRFDRAVESLRARLRALAPEQETALVAFADRVTVLTGERATAADALDALDALEPGFGRADYGALTRRLDALAAASPVPVSATVLTDAQASSLPLRANELLAPRLAALEIARVDRTDGQEPATGPRNARLEARATSADGVVARIGLRLSADGDPATAGGDRAVPRRVVVAHRGEPLASLDVAIPPGTTIERAIEPVTLPAVGEPVFDVRFDASDALAADDAERVPVRATEPVAVALGAVGTRVPRAAATFLATAFETDGRAVVEPLPGAGARVPDGVAHAVLFVDAEDENALEAVAATVRRGVDVLAVRLPRAPARGEAAPDPAGAEVARADAAHPLGLAEIDWFDLRFFAPTPFEPGADDVVLLADARGAPLLVERETGAEARLLILNDPLDGEASELPLAPAFVELVSRALEWFSASGALPERVRVGEPVALPANVQVLDPDGEALLGLADGAAASLFSPAAPGLYRVVDGRGERPLVVAVDARESDLAPMDAAAVAGWAARPDVDGEAGDAPAGAGAASGPEAASASRVAEQRARRWHWFALLPLAALLLAGETLVANRRLDVRRDG